MPPETGLHKINISYAPNAVQSCPSHMKLSQFVENISLVLIAKFHHARIML